PEIVRSGCAFRVILYGKSRFAFYFNAFYGTVIQIDVCNAEFVGSLCCFRINAKTMVLSCDLTFTGCQVFNRVIQSSVSMMHFISGYSVGHSQELMSQADTK